MRLVRAASGMVDTIERVARRRRAQNHTRSVQDTVSLDDLATALLTGTGSRELNLDDAVTLSDLVTVAQGPLGTSLYELLPPSAGAIKYVDPDGSDTTGDGSQGNPWASYQKLLNVLTPGQKGCMAPGTYLPPSGARRHLLAAGRSGTAAAPIEVYAEVPGTVLIRPGLTSPQEPFVIASGATASSYWRFRDIVYEEAGPGSNYQNIYVAGSTAGAHHVEFWNCETREANAGSGVFVEEGCHHIHFINHKSHDNHIVAAQNQSHGMYVTGDYCMILNPVVYNQDGMGIQVRTNDADGPVGVIVANWLAYNCKGVANPNAEYAGGYSEAKADGCRWHNGISYDNRNGMRGVGTGTPSPHNIASFNIANANDAGQFTRSGSSIALDYANDGSGNYAGPGDNLTSDPLLVDPAGHDFHLQPGSPAIGYGLDEFCVPFYFDNTLRTEVGCGPFGPA